jgi:hypothetical protein
LGSSADVPCVVSYDGLLLDGDPQLAGPLPLPAGAGKIKGMDENPYKPPATPGKEGMPGLRGFRLRHVPIVIAVLLGLFVLLKLVILFVELAVELLK